jgi:hypothetical protein
MKKKIIVTAGAALGVTTVALVGIRLRQEAENQTPPTLGDQSNAEIQYDDLPRQIVFGHSHHEESLA